MRRLFVVVSLSAALPSLLFAQHAGPGAAAAAPAHVSAPAPMRTASAPNRSVSSHATIAHRSGTGSHSGSSPTRISTRPRSSPVGTPVAAPRAAWEFGLPPNPIAPIPSSLAYVNSVPTLLPFGHRCFGALGCFGNRHFGNTGFIIPWGGFGGFYLPIPYYEPYSDDQGEAAPEDVQASDQSDANNGYPADNPRGQQVVAENSAAPTTEPYYSPAQPVYDFVFVKRDGTKICAVAYSLTKDKLQYVTREGLRRTLPLDALDFAATQKSNEERGNTVNLPTPPPSAMAAL